MGVSAYWLIVYVSIDFDVYRDIDIWMDVGNKISMEEVEEDVEFVVFVFFVRGQGGGGRLVGDLLVGGGLGEGLVEGEVVLVE